MKNLLNFSLLFCWALTAHAEEIWVEQSRQIARTYSVQPGSRLLLSNAYGRVQVTLWERDEISVVISITGMGRTDAEARRYAEAVALLEKRQGRLLSLETRYTPTQAGRAWNGNPQESGVRIDCQIKMPRYVPLELKNLSLIHI